MQQNVYSRVVSQAISLNGDLARESPIECVNLITESYLRLVALCQQRIGSMSFSAIAASLGGKQVRSDTLVLSAAT